MRWSFAFVLAVAAFAVGLSHRPDSFASRWSPVIEMPSEGMTIHGRVKLEWL